MQQVLAYFELTKYGCEIALADLVRNGLEIIQFQIIKEADDDYSLYVVVRSAVDTWLEEAAEHVKLYRSMGA